MRQSAHGGAHLLAGMWTARARACASEVTACMSTASCAAVELKAVLLRLTAARMSLRPQHDFIGNQNGDLSKSPNSLCINLRRFHCVG